MAKLYLIRRNLESFTGPMTLVEMKEGYKRMAFGLQDEVAGHCGSWVTFDDMPALRKQYPEVARVVNEEMLAGWGVSEHEPGADQETRRLDVRSRHRIGLAVVFFAISIIAFAVAVYLANSARLSSKQGSPVDGPTPEDAQGFIDRGDATGFDSFMRDNMSEIVDRTKKWRRGEGPFLPYLRLWAFTHEGFVNNLPQKLLRGSLAGAAPVDCSAKNWQRRWRASVTTWLEMVNEHRLPRQHWARILAWDPHWIRRREHRGWPAGLNYYVGCLTMADRALAEVASDPTLVERADDWSKLGIDKIRGRLQWLLEMTRDGRSGVSFAPAVDNDLSVWTCFEGARDFKELSRCREAISTQATESWVSYTEERYAWSLARLVFTSRGAMAPDVAGALEPVLGQLPPADYFINFDFRAEQKIIRTLAKTPGPVDRTYDKAAAEFPELRLSH